MLAVKTANKDMKDTDKTRTTRRKVLQASVGGVALPFASYTVSGQQENLPVVIRHRGTWENPLSVDRMMEVKRQAVDRHVELGGTEPDYFYNAVPGFPNHAKLIDYIVGIQSNGVPTQHIEIVGNSDSVPSARENADKREIELRQKVGGEF